MATKPLFSFVLGAWILIAGIASLADAGLETTFVEDVCSYKSYYMRDLYHKPSGIIMAVPFMRGNMENYFRCRITLLPKKRSSVVLSIYKYNLGPSDNLTIEDSDHHKIALLGKADFKDEKKSITSEGQIIIDFQTSERSSEFQFTYTQVNDYPCMDNEFQCDNKKCILKEYACDGHNHCGDNSDQKKCVPKGKHESHVGNRMVVERKSSVLVWLIAIGVCSALLLIVIIVFVVVFLRNRRKNAAASATVSPNNASVNTNLQSVSSNVPVQPQQLSANNLQRAAIAPQG
ncbi:Vitellogenin receptor, partial [Stegodyphus mimosarum]